MSEEEAREAAVGAAAGRARDAAGELVGERENRRHRPGRGFEAVSYRFEFVSDYGAFRDLQRHRLLTIQWQPLTPDLGAGVPQELRRPAWRTPIARRSSARAPSTSGWSTRAWPTWRPTPSASATASATCWT